MVQRKKILFLAGFILLIVVVGLLSFAINKYQVNRNNRASETSAVAVSDDITALTTQLLSQTNGTSQQSLQNISEQKTSSISTIASKRKDSIITQLNTGDSQGIRAVAKNLLESDQVAQVSSLVSDKALIESYEQVEGTITRIAEERKADTFFLVKPDGSKKQIYIDEPGNLVSGTTINVQMANIGDYSIAVRSRNMGFQVLSVNSSTATTAIKPKVGVFLIKYAGKTEMPITAAQMQQKMSGVKPSVQSFYLENSYGKFDFDTQVFDWIQGSFPEGDCEKNRFKFDDMANDDLAKKGIDIKAFQYRIYVLNGCAYAQSYATVGGNPAWVVLFGNSVQSQAVVSHEFGHTIGFGHACSSGSISSICDPYNDTDPKQYGDWYSLMGNYLSVGSNQLHVVAPQKALVGWLPPTQILQNPAAGVYTLSAQGKNSAGIKYIQLNNPDLSTSEEYYLEYKTAYSYDSVIPAYAPGIVQGARLIRWNGNGPSWTNLIPVNPGTVRDAAFKDKQSFSITDPKGVKPPVHITQLSHTADTVTLQIESQKGSGVLPRWAVSSVNVFDDPTSPAYTGTALGDYVFVTHLAKTPGNEHAMYRAKLGASGVLGAWERQTAMAPPDAQLDSKMLISTNPPVAFLFNNYLRNGTYNSAALNIAAGTIGTWSPAKMFISSMYLFDISIVNNLVLFSGGMDYHMAPFNAIKVFRINTDGTLAPLVDQTLPEGLASHKIIVNGNRLYLIGGKTKTEFSNRVYTATISTSGVISAWKQLKLLPYALTDVGGAVLGNNLVLIGGINQYIGTKNVYSAKINVDGSLNDWSRDTDLLRPMQQAVVVPMANNTFIAVFASRDSYSIADFVAAKYTPYIPPSVTPSKVPTPTLGSGCVYRRVQCIKAPCPMMITCTTKAPTKQVNKLLPTKSKFSIGPPSRE